MWMLGKWVAKRWWEQEGFNLVREQVAVAAAEEEGGGRDGGRSRGDIRELKHGEKYHLIII